MREHPLEAMKSFFVQFERIGFKLSLYLKRNGILFLTFLRALLRNML